jgi:hypothetical protein
MELVTFSIPKSSKRFVLAPLGDIQYSGENGPTAQDTLKRHIDNCLTQDAFFFGMGDYIDFLSPSNRSRLMHADLYDTAQDVIAEKAMELNEQVFEKFLKPTVGRWLGMVEGHHFYQGGGRTTDELLAEQLKTKFLGTSAFVRVPNADFTIYAHHGVGAGQLPGVGLNRLYHTAAGLEGADCYLLGHNTKVATARLSRPFPVWEKKPYLKHRDIWLVNCGGFSKSNIVGHRCGQIKRGDYAEARMLTPSPLSAPIITVDLTAKDHNRIRVSI